MASSQRLFTALAIVWAFTSGTCGRKPDGQRYAVTGQVLAVHPERNEVLLRHDEIPGFMPPMTMPFSVRDPRLLDGRVPGDLVRGQLVVTDRAAWLESLEKTAFESLPAESEGGKSEEIGIGDAAPDAKLVDQDGRPRALADWRGRALALTFVFTRCPLPEFCPAMDRRFVELQRLIEDKPSLRAKLRLLTISFDPSHDTAEVLRAHAARLGADPTIWVFATGETEAVDHLGSAFGLVVERDPGDPASITHNLRTAILDPQGRLVAVLSGTDWQPRDALVILEKAVRNGAAP